jgi:hypothetical protein
MYRQHRKLLAAASVVCLLAAPAAWADFSSPPLQGLGGVVMSGSEFFNQNSNGAVLNVRIDYAVFAPGDFTGTFTAFGGNPVFDPADYVYAYQIYNESSSNVRLSRLNVGFEAPIDSLGYDLNFDSAAGDVLPISTLISTDFFRFTFGTPQLAAGQFSSVLLMSSKYGPALIGSSVIDGGVSTAGELPGPTPVPVPSAAILALVGVSLLARRKWISR